MKRLVIVFVTMCLLLQGCMTHHSSDEIVIDIGIDDGPPDPNHILFQQGKIDKTEYHRRLLEQSIGSDFRNVVVDTSDVEFPGPKTVDDRGMPYWVDDFLHDNFSNHPVLKKFHEVNTLASHTSKRKLYSG